MSASLCIDGDIAHLVQRVIVQCHRNGMRVASLVRLIELYSVPLNMRTAEIVIEGDRVAGLPDLRIAHAVSLSRSGARADLPSVNAVFTMVCA